MSIQFTDLPYSTNDLEPFISKRTLEFHHGKHHRNYVSELNDLIQGTPYDWMDLEDIIIKSERNDKAIFNNAAQAWNHQFYWKCMTPKSNELSPEVLTIIENSFGTVEILKKEFIESAKKVFGSGWTWLVKDEDGSLSILNTSNAKNPLTTKQTALLTCDVWEHAYYLDVQNERAKYLNQFWEVIDWNFVELNLQNFPRNFTGGTIGQHPS